MPKTPPFIPTVLCGGSGSRLWPRSRAAMPKPFIAMPDGGGALIDRTYARLSPTHSHSHPPRFSHPRPDAVMTIVAADYAFLCEESFAAHGPDVPHWIVAEPVARDTAAATAMAAEICRQRLGEKTILLVLPADHMIENAEGFWQSAMRAMESAAEGNFSLLGIAPDHPATGYGYIQRGEKIRDGLFAVRRFVEKPDRAKAQEFLQSGDHYWNAGVFCFAAGTLHSALPKLHPELAKPLARAAQGAEKFNATGTTLFSPDKSACESFPAIAFDRAVMEKTERATVADAADIGWSDVGSWRAMGETIPADASGNRVCGEAIADGAKDCVIVGEKGRLIAAVDVCGLHIIDSPDALLVSSRDGTERTREIFARLRGRDEAEFPATVRRPWGSYTVLSEGEGHKVKRIDVLPGAKLSLQSHKRRSEHWTTVIGTMTITIDDREFEMRKNESCFIPLGARHRMANLTEGPAAVIEVQVGDYLGEDDIVRYEDIYGRA